MNVKDELQLVINYIGTAIDESPQIRVNLNELWQWLSDILGELE
jgi:hypothetical protein